MKMATWERIGAELYRFEENLFVKEWTEALFNLKMIRSIQRLHALQDSHLYSNSSFHHQCNPPLEDQYAFKEYSRASTIISSASSLKMEPV